MGILIEIDHRESAAGIKEILRIKEGICVEEKRLPIGDYLVNKHITVERKTTKDFVLSIIDGRLFSQAARLRRHTEIPFMVIEGTNLFQTGYDVDPQSIKGAIVSISVSWQIPLIFSKSPCGTAEILIMAGAQDVKYYEEIQKRMGRRPKRIQTRKLYILQGLPGVGPRIAKRILEHFGSIEKIMSASEQELASIEGIGRKKASKIREIVR